MKRIIWALLVCAGTLGAQTLTNGQRPVEAFNSSTVFVKEDFQSGSQTSTTQVGQYGWAEQLIGAAPTWAQITSTWSHPGIMGLATTSVSGQGGAFMLHSSFGTIGDPGNQAVWNSEWIAYISGTTNIAARIGFSNPSLSTKIPATAGIYFRYDTSLSDTNWMACVNTSGTETCTSAGVAPVANTFQDFFISSTTATTINFQVNTTAAVTLCASGCTAAATPPTTNLVPYASAVTLTTSSIILALDLFMYQATGITR